MTETVIKQNQNYNRMIIDSFLAQNAITNSQTISCDKIAVPLSSSVKEVFINHLIKDGFVVVESDQTLWFDKKKWDLTVKNLSNKYFMILAAPIAIVAGLLYVISLI